MTTKNMLFLFWIGIMSQVEWIILLEVKFMIFKNSIMIFTLLISLSKTHIYTLCTTVGQPVLMDIQRIIRNTYIMCFSILFHGFVNISQHNLYQSIVILFSQYIKKYLR